MTSLTGHSRGTSRGTACQAETRAKVSIIKATSPGHLPHLLGRPCLAALEKVVPVFSLRRDVRGGSADAQCLHTQTQLRALTGPSPEALAAIPLQSGLSWVEQNRPKPGGEELAGPVLELLFPSEEMKPPGKTVWSFLPHVTIM